MSSSVIDNSGRVAAASSTEAAADAGVPVDDTKGVIMRLGSAPKADWPEPVKVLLAMIRTLGANHPRDHVDEEVVYDYSERMKAGAEFPPVVLIRDSEGQIRLADGRHRYEAAKKCCLAEINAVVLEGSEREAILFAVGANAVHGMRRTNADKRKAVMILFQDPEWRQWSDNEIAKRCNVSWDLVKSVREEYVRTHPQEAEGGKPKGRKYRRYGGEHVQHSAVAAKPLPEHVKAIGEMRELACKARAAVPEAESKVAEALDRVGAELHELQGKVTGAKCRMADLPVPLNVYEHQLVGGITVTSEFEKKRLATHALNVGLGCGHQCRYCSSPSLRCRLPAYGELQLNPFDRGFAVIDPETVERILKDLPKLTEKDTVMLSTCDDAWSPEARKYEVGRKCLDALLKNTPAQIRILTKSAKVAEDFGVIKGSEKRVMVGISTGIPESREDVAAAVEPNASPIRERLRALTEAHNAKLRTFGMLCPCLPGVADSEAALTEMFKAMQVRGAEAIWLEPVNARGRALGNTATALRLAGLSAEADAVDAIRKEDAWSKYAAALTETAVKVAGKLGMLGKLKILQYADKLTPADLGRVKALGVSVILLGKGADVGCKGKAGATEQTEASGGKADAEDADDGVDTEGHEADEKSGPAT